LHIAALFLLNATALLLFRHKVKHKRLTMSEKNIKETIGEYLLKLGHQLTNTDENGLKPEEAAQVHEVKFMVESMLEDGTTNIASPSDEWAAGVEVYIIANGEQMPLPTGEYVLADGSLLTVENDGIVANYTPAQAEEEEGENIEQDANAVAEAPAPTPQAKSVIESVVKETKFDAEKELEILRAELATYKNLINEKFSAVAGSVDVITNELVELSKPMDKVKHSPEKNTKTESVKLSANEIANLPIAKRIEYYQSKFKK
jgi:hypothetical protein